MDSVTRLLSAYRKYASDSQVDVKLTLVVPVDLPPTCEKYDEIEDLWTHPLQNDKWDDITIDKRYLLEPAEMINTGRSGPISANKSFWLVTLAANNGPVGRHAISWIPNLLQQEVGPVILVDVPVQRWTRLQHSVETMELRNNIKWDKPSRSPASSNETPRVVIRGYLPIGTSGLEANLSIIELRSFFNDDTCIAARQELLRDKSALIIEFTNAEGLLRKAAYLEEVIFLSSKKALAKTSTPASAWHDLLTHDMRSQPSSCITKILWRKSYRGGNIWAQPAATVRQMQMIKAQAGVKLQGKTPGQSIGDLDTDLEVAGALGPDPQLTLRNIMMAVGVKMQFPFREVKETLEKQAGDWSMTLDPATGKLNGKIVVRLESAQEVVRLEKTIHSSTVQIGKEKAIVSVHNKMIDRLPAAWQGNALVSPLGARGGAPAGQ
jgi:hypothetical protein